MHLLEFPDEVLLVIIGNLGLSDRKNLRLVNKRLYELAWAKSVIKDDILVVETSLELVSVPIRRKAHSLKILKANRETCSQFWSECGAQITTLRLLNVDLTAPSLLKILESVPNVHDLGLSSDDINGPWKKEKIKPGERVLHFKRISLPELVRVRLRRLRTDPDRGYLHELFIKSPKLECIIFSATVVDVDDCYFVRKCLANAKNVREVQIIGCDDVSLLYLILRNVESRVTTLRLWKMDNWKLKEIEMHLLELPEEVLLHIIHYLALRDRKNLRLVNKHLYELTYAKSVIKNDVLVVETTQELLSVSIRRKAYSLKIKKTNSETCTPFWSECGAQVNSLELYLVDLTEPFLLKILQSVPNLEYLVLSSFDEHDKCKVRPPAPETPILSFKEITLPKLLSIDFYHLQTSREGRNLHELITKSPKLKRMSFEWMVNQLDDCSFVQSCLTAHGKDLKELDFSYSQLSDSMLELILRDVGSQLTGLYLRKCTNLRNPSFKYLAGKFPELKEVDLAMTSFEHEDIYTFLQSFHNLTHVSLRQTNLQELGQCLDNSHKKLKALELSNCKRWNANNSLMVQSPFPNLVDLRIDYLRCINDESFKTIIPFITNIKFLILNGNRKITDKSMSVLAETCTKLRSLSLQDTRVSNIEWANRLKGLVHLDLYGCVKVTKDSILKLNLLELQTLDLSLTQADFACFDIIIGNCPSLLHVYVDCITNPYSPSREWTKFHYGMSRFAPDSIFDS